jgi:hypothetical protein
MHTERFTESVTLFPKAEPLATVRTQVQVPNYVLTKYTAEAQYPGYRAVQTHIDLHQNFEIKSEHRA